MPRRHAACGVAIGVDGYAGMGDFLLIALSARTQQALDNAVVENDDRRALVQRLQARTASGVLTVSHGDLEKMLVHFLSCRADHGSE